MLPPEYFDHAADDILALYSQLDETIIRDITRRLVKTGNVSATADWQIERLQQSGLLYEDIIQRVAEITDASEQQVQALFEDAGTEALAWDMKVYESAGLSPVPLRMSPSAMQVLVANLYKTQGHLQNLTMTTAITSQQAYINAATLAEMQVESGAFDYATAMRNALKSAIGDGATVLYPTGHVDKLDVAIRRAVLTGVGQTTAQISLAYADDMGCDMVETTAHAGARPEHAAWQGRIFSRAGNHKKYPDFVKSTGYGTGAGLCGWNCRHSFYPYFEGLSESAYPRRILDEYNNRTVTYNDKKLPYYDATQVQRGYERMIRAEKRKLSAYDEGIKTTDSDELRARLQEDFSASSVELKEIETELRDFLKQTGIDRQSVREQVLGFNRSVSSKAVHANKKALEKA